MNAYQCRCLNWIPDVAAQLNGGIKPAAMTIGGTTVFFQPPDDRMKRHEYKHVQQAASFAPWWARWLPIRARAWAGEVGFLPAYLAEHHEHGYTGNRFEIEARAAENAP